MTAPIESVDDDPYTSAERMFYAKLAAILIVTVIVIIYVPGTWEKAAGLLLGALGTWGLYTKVPPTV